MKDKIHIGRPSRGFIFALGIIFLPICLYITTAYRDWSFICENTASKKGYREWCCGWKTGQWYSKSLLEVFMRARYPKQMKHRWTSYASTEGNFLGLTRRGGHGMPGPVIKMSFMIDPYMKIIDDPQKKALYDLLASTNRPAMYAKELEICNKLLESNR